MKTATMPALRVQPELRKAAEETLRPGETLSAFVEDALRRNVELRRAQQEFIERGLAAREEARPSGKYVSAGKVLGKLAAPLEKAADLNALFADPEVKAILCAQGGDTANACLPYLDWELIARNPKVMGPLVISRKLAFGGWLATGVMFAVAGVFLLS